MVCTVIIRSGTYAVECEDLGSHVYERKESWHEKARA